MIPLAIKGEVDNQGRIVIPKEIRERKGLKGSVEIEETEEGIIIRPPRDLVAKWKKIFENKLKVGQKQIEKTEDSWNELWVG